MAKASYFAEELFTINLVKWQWVAKPEVAEKFGSHCFLGTFFSSNASVSALSEITKKCQNRIARGTAMSFFTKLVPILIIVVFSHTYYAYVVELCVLKIAPMLKKILYLVGYHICLVPVTIHYFVVIFLKSGPVPSSYRFGIVELQALSQLEPEDRAVDRILERFCYYRGIQTYMRKNNRIRYCMKCKHIKPDRTHHCSSCKCCVLKMDHHCPWIDNCIHFNNYKIFFLLLIHTSLYCIFYICTCAEYVYEFCFGKDWELRQVNYVTSFFISILVGVAVTALLGFHIALMLRNQTTLEAMSEPMFVDACTFDVGQKENFLEVFGYNCCLWCLPVPSALGNGVHFPIRYY